MYRRGMAVSRESSSGTGAGRERQRRRTRAAIVAATAELLRAGQTPSVNEVAEAAEVSRRTVYQYFPSLEQLLLDATVGLLSQASVDEVVDATDSTGDPAARVAAMVHAFVAMSADTLPLGRALIRLTVDGPPPPGGSPRRGYRRVQWLERALEPVRADLDPAAFERLVSALALVVGWEALVVLQDLRGLPPDDQEDVTTWAARALVRVALEEARG